MRARQDKGTASDNIGALPTGKVYDSEWRALMEPAEGQACLHRSLRALRERAARPNELAARMDALAADGWCVVIKRLPPGMGWTVEGIQSEDQAPSEDQTLGPDLWYCKAQDVGGRTPWRRSQWGLGETIEDALQKVAAGVAAENRKGDALRTDFTRWEQSLG